MGADSSIQWCDDTLNVWHGCTKVSAGCVNCYAEVSTPVRVQRSRGLELWGPKGERRETKSWEANLRAYARKAIATGKRRRVFAQSLSDTFEDRRDLDALRARFFAAIDALSPYQAHMPKGSGWTSSPLDFLLLTKRPENVLRMVPASWLKSWPPYVWIGCTVESQAMADERLPHLARIPAAVRFVSVEPQIGPVDVSRWLRRRILETNDGRWMWNTDPGVESVGGTWWWGIDWVIQGGESGSKARPFDLAWARRMRDDCMRARVAYFCKQLGAQPDQSGAAAFEYGSIVDLRDSHGGDESEWPADLRGCRAFPEVANG